MPDNLVTKKTRSLRHHCTTCHGALVKACLKRCHVDVCDAQRVDGRPCGELFTVKSQGCRQHPYAEGFNLGVKAGIPNYKRRDIKKLLHELDIPNLAAGKQVEVDATVLMTNGQARKHKIEIKAKKK